MLKLAAVFLLLVSFSWQVCDKGCLKCNEKDECLLCDTSSNYYLATGTCAVSTLSSCAVLNMTGDCGICQTGFFLDESTKKCVAIEEAKKVTGCNRYGSLQTCLQCAKGFYMKDSKCLAVINTVENCEYYENDGKCQICTSGFMFDSDRIKCVKITSITGCAGYTFIDCKSCVDGYVLNRNQYISQYKSNAMMIYADILRFSSSQNADWSSLNICQRITNTNCLAINSSNVCTRCAPSYFLTTAGVCRPFPVPVIPNCSTYSALEVCTSCNSGFYLEAPSKCTQITDEKLIPECILYDSKASSVKCLKCSEAKFLNSNNCASRIDSLQIENCAAVSIDYDNCAACANQYVPTDDRKKCLGQISNCAEYASSTRSSTSMTCKVCSKGFILIKADSGSTSCISGAIQGCATYTSETVCNACENGFYLAKETCTKQPTVENCVTYHSSNHGECTSCKQGFYPLKLSEVCQTVSTPIPNCAAYKKNSDTCEACQPGFFLQSNACVALSTLPNCAGVDATSACNSCADTYALKADKTCVLNHDYIFANCEVKAPNAAFKAFNVAENTQCLLCKENSYPTNIGLNYGCISSSILDTKVSATIANCKRYQFNIQVYCAECNLGYFLFYDASNIGSCVPTCDLNTNSNLLEDPITTEFNVCQAQGNTIYALPSCSIVIIGSTGTSKAKSCIKLAPGQPATVKLIIDSPNASDNSSWYKDIEDSTVPKFTEAFIYFGYKVNVSTSGTDVHSTALPVPNPNSLTANDLKCELYWKNGSNYICWRCKWGFTVNLTSAPATSCVQIPCNKTVKYGGFSSNLNQLLSCHACTDTTKVITVFLVTSTVSDLLVANQVSGKNTIQCLTPLTAATDTHTEAQPKKIDRCLIYGTIFTSAAGVNTFSSASSGCLACEPGYRPTDQTKSVFQNCLPIPNCDNNKPFYANRCHTCTQTNNTGGAEYKAFKDLTLQDCQLTNTSNCFIGSTTFVEGVYRCSQCMPGYFLNKDYKCEKLAMPKCSDNDGINLFGEPLQTTLSLGLYYTLKNLAPSKHMRGCTNCESGFTAVMMPNGERQCLTSGYVTAGVFPTVPASKYVTDCMNYKNEQLSRDTLNASCYKCKNGKIPSHDGSKCVVPNSSSCLEAQNAGTGCYSCINTHVAVGGVCLLANIKNCLLYDTSPDVIEIMCNQCADGFILAQNKKSCLAGNIVGCRIYDIGKPNICTACSTGFNLVSTANGGTYCFKTNESTNCLSLETGITNGLQSNRFKCNTCKVTNTEAYVVKNYDSNDETKPQSLCFPLNLVKNCLEYSQSQYTVSGNTFLCTLCQKDFFLDEDTNTCKPRAVQPVGCTKYVVNKDQCDECNISSFLNANKTLCINNPTGIAGCSSYSDDSICSSCYPPKYLSNNTCTNSTVINKCAFYSANNTCTGCERGYFLTNSTYCQPAKAKDCYTYVSINACESCDPANPNKGLRTDLSGVTSCVDKNVANCELSTNEYPFRCNQCKKAYYPASNGTCISTSPIDKCLIYDSSTTCSKCDQGSVLSADRKLCLDRIYAGFIDENCAENYLLSNAICARCSPGQVFSNGACTACTNNTFDSGCFICDAKNQTACLACRPGYFQNAKGGCVSLNGQTVTNTTVSSARILRILGLLWTIELLIGFI